MANYFIVATQSESPLTYLFQGEVGAVLESLHAYSISNRRFHIYEIRVLDKNEAFNPKGCHQLALVGVVEPFDVVSHYRTLLGIEIDNLPVEQREEEIVKAIDHMERKRQKAEAQKEGLVEKPAPPL